MINGWLYLPWFVWAGITLFIAVSYYFIWPQKAVTSTTGFRYFIVRWGHSLTWILITINFLLRGISPSLNGGADVIALAGGVMYVLFRVMTLEVK